MADPRKSKSHAGYPNPPAAPLQPGYIQSIQPYHPRQQQLYSPTHSQPWYPTNHSQPIQAAPTQWSSNLSGHGLVPTKSSTRLTQVPPNVHIQSGGYTHQSMQQQQQPQQQQHYSSPPPQQGGYPIQQQPASGYAPANQLVNWYANAPFQSYLSSATSFRVEQKLELLEVFTGWETGNQYTARDQSGHEVFYVGEQSGCLQRQICGRRRGFTLVAKDLQSNTVLQFQRGLNCTCCCGLCCPDSLTVSTAGGQLIGSVLEEFNLLYPSFSLKNATGNTLLRISGPLCAISFICGSVEFQVLNTSGQRVGTISKDWSGAVQELVTDADNFSMSFPVDLDPAMKAVCLGALFLIDYEYFEESCRSKRQGGRKLLT